MENIVKVVLILEINYHIVNVLKNSMMMVFLHNVKHVNLNVLLVKIVLVFVLLVLLVEKIKPQNVHVFGEKPKSLENVLNVIGIVKHVINLSEIVLNVLKIELIILLVYVQKELMKFQTKENVQIVTKNVEFVLILLKIVSNVSKVELIHHNVMLVQLVHNPLLFQLYQKDLLEYLLVTLLVNLVIKILEIV